MDAWSDLKVYLAHGGGYTCFGIGPVMDLEMPHEV